MRIIGEIPNPHMKITLFHWNNRYLIKLESGFLEQTYKISEFDVSSEDQVIAMIDEEFIKHALTRFQEMANSFHSTQERHL